MSFQIAKKEAPRKILLRLTEKKAEILWTGYLVSSLKKKFPGAELHLLASPQVERFEFFLSGIDRFYQLRSECEKFLVVTEGRGESLEENFCTEIEKSDFELVYDLSHIFRSISEDPLDPNLNLHFVDRMYLQWPELGCRPSRPSVQTYSKEMAKATNFGSSFIVIQPLSALGDWVFDFNMINSLLKKNSTSSRKREIHILLPQEQISQQQKQVDCPDWRLRLEEYGDDLRVREVNSREFQLNLQFAEVFITAWHPWMHFVMNLKCPTFVCSKMPLKILSEKGIFRDRILYFELASQPDKIESFTDQVISETQPFSKAGNERERFPLKESILVQGHSYGVVDSSSESVRSYVQRDLEAMSLQRRIGSGHLVERSFTSAISRLRARIDGSVFSSELSAYQRKAEEKRDLLSQLMRKLELSRKRGLVQSVGESLSFKESNLGSQSFSDLLSTPLSFRQHREVQNFLKVESEKMRQQVHDIRVFKAQLEVE